MNGYLGALFIYVPGLVIVLFDQENGIVSLANALDMLSPRGVQARTLSIDRARYHR